ncbi:TPA: right-handed parallel beta-helix repeat-containing protein [Candidatus Poribacteria bacterium]|nr:right-handed parallel beta-helix repeat-containing protein [Candidatus Poribacteria bacterium]
MKPVVLLALVSVLMFNLVIASYGKILSESDLPQLEPQLWRLINSLNTKSLLASRLAKSNRIEAVVASKGRLIVFDPNSIALDLFSETEVGVTIEFLFVPLNKQGVLSLLFLWEGPFPKLVDRSYWFWGTEMGGEISEDTIWALDGSPYYVTSDVSVQSDVTLTVEPGVEVRFKKFSDFSGVKVGLSVYGNLVAEGTEASPIVFTTSCDFEDLDQMQGEWIDPFTEDFFPTDWKGVRIDGDSGILSYCVVEYAETNIRAEGESVTLQVYNSSLRGSKDGIAFVSGLGSATIMNNTIERYGHIAVVLNGGTATISGNTITIRRGQAGIQTHGQGGMLTEVTGNIISSIPGFITYWGMHCYESSPTISGNDIIGPFGQGIVVTDGSAPTITGNTITNCSDGIWSVYYGVVVGDGSAPTVTGPTITGNTITNCGNGVWNGIGGLPLTINYNNIFGNDDWGVYNEGCSITIDAENNWWGDVSGPYHPTENPDGLGDAVSDCVDFEPWLTEPVEP